MHGRSRYAKQVAAATAMAALGAGVARLAGNGAAASVSFARVARASDRSARAEAVDVSPEPACRARKMELTFAVRRIEAIDVEGQHLRPLTHPPAGYADAFPSWSPDGTLLAFQRENVVSNSFLPSVDIYVAEADGSRPMRRVRGGFGPVWSPTGRQFLYGVSTGHDDYWQVTDADGSGHTIELPPDAVDAVWSPDGRRIALVTSDGSLVLTDNHGKGRRTLSRGAHLPLAWSPDGQSIAFGTQAASGGIDVAHIDGSRRKQVVDEKASSLAWSPDGTQLAFVAQHAAHTQLDVVNADGSGRKQLARGSGLKAPAWSPDGRWIAFTKFMLPTFSIYLVKPDGMQLHRLQKLSDPQGWNSTGELTWKPCTR
jgi:Tol biopolymer transport system component